MDGADRGMQLGFPDLRMSLHACVVFVLSATCLLIQSISQSVAHSTNHSFLFSRPLVRPSVRLKPIQSVPLRKPGQDPFGKKNRSTDKAPPPDQGSSNRLPAFPAGYCQEPARRAGADCPAAAAMMLAGWLSVGAWGECRLHNCCWEWGRWSPSIRKTDR